MQIDMILTQNCQKELPLTLCVLSIKQYIPIHP